MDWFTQFITFYIMKNLIRKFSREAERYSYSALQKMKEGNTIHAYLDFISAKTYIDLSIKYTKELLKLYPDNSGFIEGLETLKQISKMINKYLEKLQPTETH